MGDTSTTITLPIAYTKYNIPLAVGFAGSGDTSNHNPKVEARTLTNFKYKTMYNSTGFLWFTIGF